MPIELKMPALSPTMEEGTLAKWLVKEGDEVKSGDILAEIETDKATMEFEAVDEGKIAKILVPEGTDGVKVGAPIAIMAGEGEDASTAASSAPPPPRARDSRAQLGRERGLRRRPTQPGRHRARPGAGRNSASAEHARRPLTRSRSPAGGEGERIKASPLARKLAQAQNIDLSTLQGSGPGGRIVRADIDAAVGKAPAGAPAAQPAAAAAPALGTHLVMPGPMEQAIPHEEVKLSNIRKTIARRLTEAKQQVPHIYLTVDIQLDALLKLRGELNAGPREPRRQAQRQRPADQGARPVADRGARMQRRLRRRPDAEVQPRRHFGRGVDPRRADHADHRQRRHQERVRHLDRDEGARRPRARRQAPAAANIRAAPRRLSNMGMFGIKQFEAVINPPQGMIMAIGAGEKRPYVINDSLQIATIMSATGSFDHRAIDGADGAKLMKAFKRLVENPLGMLA